MWELDHKEAWVLKNLRFGIVALEKTLESSLDRKESNPVNLKENHPWIFIGKTDAEAPILWPPDVTSWLTGKDPDAGKDWAKRGREQQSMRWLGSITDSMDMNLSKLREREEKDREWRTEKPGLLQFMGLQRVGHNSVTEQQQPKTEWHNA